MPKTTPYGKWMACPNGHTQPELNQEKNVLNIKNQEEGKIIEVCDGKNILAVYDHICKKCGHDKSEMLEIGCFYSDEDNVVRMKCGQCGFVEQMEGKIQ